MARIDLLKAQQEARQNQTPVQQGNEAHVANVRQQAQQMAATPPPTQPVLQKVDPTKVYESTRNQALAATDESKAEQSMEFWNTSPLEYWSQQAAKDPSNTYAYLQKMYASDETPEEKRKRERREALGQAFQGLGNLIGNAANLYYTHRGGQYIDLNTANEKHLERMRRLKEKQDALAEKQRSILANAKIGDIKADREAAILAETRAYNDRVRKEQQERDDAAKAQTQANWQKTFDWNVSQAEEKAKKDADAAAYKREQDKIANSLAWAQIDLQKQRLNASKSGSTSKGGKDSDKRKMAVIYTPNGVMDVDFAKINDTTYEQLYNQVADDIKEKYKVRGSDDENTIKMKKSQAISEALLSQSGYSDLLQKAGVGVYQQQQQAEATAKDDNTMPGLGKAPDDSTMPGIGAASNQSSDMKKDISSQANVSANTEQQDQASQKTDTQTPAKQYGNKYEAMAAKKRDEIAAEAAAKKLRIEKAMKRNVKNIEDAKTKRQELMNLINAEYPEIDIDSLINSNGIGAWDAWGIRKQYADDSRERASIQREIDRLTSIIDNSRNYNIHD